MMTSFRTTGLQALHRSVLVLLLSGCLVLGGCVGAVVGAAVDTTIEVAKVPFKVAGAVVDVVIPDGDDEE